MQADCYCGVARHRLVIDPWECSVRTGPSGQAYLWAVKRRAWLADWEHGAGDITSSLEEAMYEAEIALQRASGVAIK